MKRGIKSYLAFASVAYRVILFVLVPIGIIGFQGGLAVFYRHLIQAGAVELEDATRNDTILMLLTIIILASVEILMDNWAFGGIAVKGGGSLDYIKASPRGRQLVRTALKTNLIRICLESVAVLFLSRAAWTVAGGFAGVWTLKHVVAMLAMAANQYFVTIAALLVVRHFEFLMANVIAASISYLVLILLLFLTALNVYVMLAVMTLLSVGISVLSQRRIMRRVEESYYDERPKAGI